MLNTKSVLALCLLGTLSVGSAGADAPAKDTTAVTLVTREQVGPAPDRGFGPPGDEPCDPIQLTCGVPVQVNLAMFTSNPQDPSFTCRVPTAGRGVNTAWLSFIAQNNRVTLSTSGTGAADDSLLAVYSGVDCATNTQIACDDDSGLGNFSLITINNLVIGQTYRVQLAAYSASDVGTYTLTMDCRPDYDECAGALNLACNSSVEVDLSICTTVPGDPIFPCKIGGGAGDAGLQLGVGEVHRRAPEHAAETAGHQRRGVRQHADERVHRDRLRCAVAVCLQR